MKNHGPRIFDGHVEHDEASILAALEQPGKFHGLSVPQWRDLAKFFRIAEGNNLQRDGNVYVGFDQQGGKHSAHLLEAHGHFAAALFPRAGIYGKMRRLDFHPLRLSGRGWRGHSQCRSEGKQPTRHTEARSGHGRLREIIR
jgi:hypothetical protein